MIQIELVLMAFAIFCFVMALGALLDLRSIARSMRLTTGRMIRRCDSMIAVCDGAGKIVKKIIKSRGRK